MQTSKHAGFVAQVRAKDDEDHAMAQLRVTFETTVGELLKFYRWRQDDQGGYDIGFTIDLSPAGKPEVKRRSSDAAGSAEAAEVPIKKQRVAEEIALGTRAESSTEQTEAGPAVEEVGTWRKLEELFKIEHPVPEADQEGLTAAVGTNAVVYKNEESSSVKAESSSAFNITVAFSWIGDIGVKVKPKTPIRKICFAACKQLNVDFASVRFMFNDYRISMEDSDFGYGPDRVSERTMLIRDPNAPRITAQDWELEEGDRIEAILCQCGC